MNLSIAGNVGRDAEVRSAGAGQVCNFSVAVNGYDFKARKKTTTWIRVAVWGKRAEKLGELITKGSKVACSGQLEIGEYNGKAQYTLTAQDVTILSPGESRDGSGGHAADAAPDDAYKPTGGGGDDSDVPFAPRAWDF